MYADDSNSEPEASARESRVATARGGAPREAPMTSLRQLQFMQSWGERRQASWPQQRHNSTGQQQPQPPGAPPLHGAVGMKTSQLTFVPSTAWQGLPSDVTSGTEDPLAAAAAAAAFARVEDDVEAPSSAELARTDQLSEESAASVQSLCDRGGGAGGGGAGGNDDDGGRAILRDPAEVAAMLRRIRLGQRHLYAEDAYALRLEGDFRAELLAELDRQDRLDARLDDVDSEDGKDSRSTQRDPVDAPTASAGQSDKRSDLQSDLQSRGGGAGSGNNTGSQKKTAATKQAVDSVAAKRSDCRSDRRAGGGGVGIGLSQQRVTLTRDRGEPAATAASKAAREDWMSGSASSSDSEDEDDRRVSNRCRWRRSRVSSGGSNASNSSDRFGARGRRRRHRQLQQPNRNYSNAQSAREIAGCCLVPEDYSGASADDDELIDSRRQEGSDFEDDEASLQFNSSVPAKRPAYRIMTDSSGPREDKGRRKDKGKDKGKDKDRLHHQGRSLQGSGGGSKKFPEYSTVGADEPVNLGGLYERVERMEPGGAAVRILDPKNMVVVQQVDRVKLGGGGGVGDDASLLADLNAASGALASDLNKRPPRTSWNNHVVLDLATWDSDQDGGSSSAGRRPSGARGGQRASAVAAAYDRSSCTSGLP